MTKPPEQSELLKQARTALRHAAHLYVKSKDKSKRMELIENLENAAFTLTLTAAMYGIDVDRKHRIVDGKEDE